MGSMAGMQQEAANALASMTLLTPPPTLDSPNLLWEPSRLLSHIQELAADCSTDLDTSSLSAVQLP